MPFEPFFEIESTKPKRNRLEDLRYNNPGEPDCHNCGLDKLGCKRPRIPVTGKGRKKVLFVLEAPGDTEDKLGKNVVGDTGTFLANTLKPEKIILHEDCWTINSVNCRPPKNRKPSDHEMLCCRPFLLKTIEELKPKHIWLFGGAAVSTYLGDRFKKKAIGRWVGITFPDPENGAWVTSLYHPSYLLRNPKDEHLKATNKRYIKKAAQTLGWKPFEFVNYEEQVVILTQFKKVMFHLKRIFRSKPEITIDYEATGLKPYKLGHKIYCVSIDDGERSYVFPLQRPGHWSQKEYEEIWNLYLDILEDPEIPKTAHSRNMEDSWSTQILGAKKVRGWDWCTMHTAHLIDTRKNYCGLKFQSFIHFGVKGYEDEIKPFLTTDKGAEFNNIQNAPPEKLHLYCGLDTVLTRELKKVQQQYLINCPDLKAARRFTMEGLEGLMEVQNRGIPGDKQYFEAENQRLTKRINRLERLIYQNEEVELFKKKTGRSFNYRSTKDLQVLFFDVLNLKPIKYTNEKETNTAVDKEVLMKMDSKVASNITLCKKFLKIRDTYLAQFFREITEKERIHPVQNLHIAGTHRSSQNSPNFQNIPVRDEDAKRSCRSGIKASKETRLVEKDYGSQEVRIIGCYSEDPVLIKYIEDSSTDMHRDEAASIFILPKNRVHKMIRFYAKNCWVFPQFYRSWYKSCSKDLWKNVVMPDLETADGESIQEHLKSKGIYTEQSFEKHCKKVEGVFWDKYKGVKRWQNKVLKAYLQKGYVETFFGHRRTGFLTPNEVVNTPIQGTAFHCLLWSLKEAVKRIPDMGFRSRINNQIHDSMKSEVYPDEQTEYIEMVRSIAEDEIREKHKWLIVPLLLEIEMTPIGGSWYQKEEVFLADEKFGSGLWHGMWVSLDKEKNVKHVYNEEY